MEALRHPLACEIEIHDSNSLKAKERQENVFLALRLLCCYLISLKAVLQRSQNTRESLVEFNESCAFKELANLHLFSSFLLLLAANSVETGNYNKNCSWKCDESEKYFLNFYLFLGLEKIEGVSCYFFKRLFIQLWTGEFMKMLLVFHKFIYLHLF